MNTKLRKTIIAGNWKMNKTPAEAVALIDSIKTELDNKKTDACEIIACVPYLDIACTIAAAKNTPIKIGAENVHWEKSGAFTGEISADMLKSVGVEYVIVGHSERRQYFGETNVTVNKRVKAALEAGLKVILCVGELLEQREQGITSETVSLQTKIALMGISESAMQNVIIAYEPVWAIGTGRTATSEQADEVCGIIREVISSLYSKSVANATTIQYGGSMNAKNAAELLAMENVDGGLIGGASLKAADFGMIIAAANA
ncbi:MAG: triose-phosphate isomerase [Clostridia bacterium]